MDEAEAKLILASHTLGPQPEGDPRFDEALAVAESSPELSAWWDETKQTDKAAQEKIRSFEPPADLRAALNASLDSASAWRIRRRRFTQLFALAACLVLFFTVGLDMLIDRSDEYAGPLAERAYQYSYDGPRLSYFNKDTQKIQDWLIEQNFDLPDQLPPQLLAQEGIGCRPLDWSDSRVAILCFNADTVYHLFVGQESEFADFEASEKFKYDYKDTGWTVTTWKSNGYALVLTAKATPQDMTRMLASYTP
ncbi:MAG: hypothetical protein AAGB46_02380 [Verrucomicrobiota bacterium]